MSKICKKIFLIIAFLFLFTSAVKAEEKIAGSSALIEVYGKCEQSKKTELDYFVKKIVLKEFFQSYNSPLADKSEVFVYSCQKYDIDCYLLPSIASIESYYGKRYIFSYHNPFGWGGGYYKFNSLDEAIETVAKKLKYKYIEKGAFNLQLIGKYYSEDPSWWIKTSRVKNRLQNLEKRYSLLLGETIVE